MLTLLHYAVLCSVHAIHGNVTNNRRCSHTNSPPVPSWANDTTYIRDLVTYGAFIWKLVYLVNLWTLGVANSTSDGENAYKWAKNIYRQIKKKVKQGQNILKWTKISTFIWCWRFFDIYYLVSIFFAGSFIFLTLLVSTYI